MMGHGKSWPSCKGGDVIQVYVRWHDAYSEEFICEEARHGSDLLWLGLATGQNRHIPLRSVRWFSVNPTSREPRYVDKPEG